MEVEVDRNQYGVGQGCFHAQRVRVNILFTKPLEYRFVYDCGADTGAIGKSKKPINWAIAHLAGTDDSSCKSLEIKTVYVSHFEKDHINGISELVRLTNVREIVIPHLSISLFARTIAQQIANGSIGKFDKATKDYLEILEGAASENGGPFPDVTTTRVPPTPSENNDSGERNLLELPREIPGENSSITETIGPGGSWDSRYSRILQIGTSGEGGKTNFWELRVWSYAESQQVTNAVVAELSALKDASGNVALTNMLLGKIDPKEIQWAISNAPAIQDAYATALKKTGVTYASNHNAVSLCLYSGPWFSPTSVSWASSQHHAPYWQSGCCYDCFSDLDFTAWIATGDALLEKTTVWAGFTKHFGSRLGKCLTILMPHHGSSVGYNFNPNLLPGSDRLAVFSAGAFNKHMHPGREVLESVADQRCISVTVTEYSRPGFFEHLAYY